MTNLIEEGGTRHPEATANSEGVGETTGVVEQTREKIDKLGALRSEDERRSREARHEVLEQLQSNAPDADRDASGFPDFVYGDFEDQRGAKKIQLTPRQSEALQDRLEVIVLEDRLLAPSILSGRKTATEYDSRATNWSTMTRIETLPDGKKVFIVNSYPLSDTHRILDGFMKWTQGCRIKKARGKAWKRQFEAKSNVPVIEQDNPRMVVMPFIPNVNAHDLFATNHGLQDTGEVAWARDAALDDKLQIAEDIVRELAVLHSKGTTWGEFILPNIIITKERRPVIVDPEMRYNKDVPLLEQKARDLRDIIFSVVGALRRSEKITNTMLVVDRLLNAHPDQQVRAEVRRLCRDVNWFQKNFPIHDLVRLGISRADYRMLYEHLGKT